MNTTDLITLAGGLGLLLLGMKLMTDGLKLAAGGFLRRALTASTKTPLRGILSGFVMTSAVQSSSAVTVAAIGFVNAGIMALTHCVWVVYGSNVGTTTTAWLVAMLGLKVSIKALALPLIAVGTALWIAGSVSRRAALGEALAGFGLFFLGIEYLQGAFLDLGTSFDLTSIALPGLAGYAAFAAVGFALTCLMQSSSATMALVLTATAGGMIPIEQAAAAVIGANVGTTSTAALAVIGATPQARRVAALHMVFNLLTGCVAIALLPVLVDSIISARASLGMDAEPASVLALFHSVFNILGVLVMVPITPALVRFLESRFRTAEEDEGRPCYLDRNTLSTPAVAVGALGKETERMADIARRVMHSALNCTTGHCREVDRSRAVMDKLHAAIADFATRVSKAGLSQRAAEVVPDILRSARYFAMAGEQAQEAVAIVGQLEDLEGVSVQPLWLDVLEQAQSIILHADPVDERYDERRLLAREREFETRYQELKLALLDAGARAGIGIPVMVAHLDYMSCVHRMVDQVVKGACQLSEVRAASVVRKARSAMKG
ncbi:Na/Pi cotransporter family protein [Desulfobaculum sp.]